MISTNHPHQLSLGDNFVKVGIAAVVFFFVSSSSSPLSIVAGRRRLHLLPPPSVFTPTVAPPPPPPRPRRFRFLSCHHFLPLSSLFLRPSTSSSPPPPFVFTPTVAPPPPPLPGVSASYRFTTFLRFLHSPSSVDGAFLPSSCLVLSVFVFDCLFFVVGCLDLASGFLTTLVLSFYCRLFVLLFLGRRDLSSGYPSFLTREGTKE